MYYELTDHFAVASDIERTWQFFSAAENLPAITPPWLRFAIGSSPEGGIRQDSLLDYTIRWSGIPIRWRTRIIDWQPPRQFIDLQIRGPYTLWHHQHSFEPLDGRTECRDRVIYKLPLGLLGRVGHALTVKRQLLDIFRFRRRIIGELLGKLELLQDDVQIRRL